MMGVGLDKVLCLGPWPNSRKITDWDRNMALTHTPLNLVVDKDSCSKAAFCKVISAKP